MATKNPIQKQAEDFQKQAADFLAPVKALNELALANTERLVEMQVQSFREYADVALDNWKAALAVKDMDGAQKYFAKQNEVAQEVAKKLASDAKVVVELGQEYISEVQKVVTSNFEKAAKKAA